MGLGEKKRLGLHLDCQAFRLIIEALLCMYTVDLTGHIFCQQNWKTEFEAPSIVAYLTVFNFISNCMLKITDLYNPVD